jgi:hypothetical protein
MNKHTLSPTLHPALIPENQHPSAMFLQNTPHIPEPVPLSESLGLKSLTVARSPLHRGTLFKAATPADPSLMQSNYSHWIQIRVRVVQAPLTIQSITRSASRISIIVGEGGRLLRLLGGLMRVSTRVLRMIGVILGEHGFGNQNRGGRRRGGLKLFGPLQRGWGFQRLRNGNVLYAVEILSCRGPNNDIGNLVKCQISDTVVSWSWTQINFYFSYYLGRSE